MHRLQQITLYGSNSSDPTNPPSGWTNLSYYKGSDTYCPVAVIMLPEGTKVRHLSIMTAHREGIITLKEVQVFACPRKFYFIISNVRISQYFISLLSLIKTH